MNTVDNQVNSIEKDLTIKTLENRIARLYREVEILKKEIKQKDTLLLKHSERFIKELEMARELQHELLPKGIPQRKKVNLSHRYMPMEQVGGDFFDYIYVSENKIGIFISDVSGHGISAAFITSMIKTVIVDNKNLVSTPRKLLYVINLELCARIREHFVTAAFGIIDLDEKTFHFATMGHPPILLYKSKDRTIKELSTHNTVMGIIDNLAIESAEIQLETGDRLLFYTDGIYEVFNENRVEFGLDNLKSLYLESSEFDFDKALDNIITIVTDYSKDHKLSDDIALVLLELDS